MTLSPFRQLAREVRARLCGHWSAALGILLLPAAVLVLYGYVSGYLIFLCRQEWLSFLLGVPVFLLVLRPMALGILRWWAALAAEHDTFSSSVLYYFTRSRYLSALQYTLRLLGHVFLRLLPYFLAVLGWTVFLCFRGYSELSDALTLHLLVASLTESCTLFGPLAIIFLLPLFFADYLYVTRSNPTPIQDSVVLYSRRSSYVISLLIRCFGWFLLSLLIFPLLYTLPYLGMTYAVFCKWMTHMTTD